MATVMRAKKLIVVAAGTDCADAAVRTLGGEISNAVPASYLQLHQNVTFILDEEAASLL
jgi:glucosamine-6-phosphate deaminase